MKLNKTQTRILEAVERGYSVVEGKMYGPRGVLSTKLTGLQRYPTFSTNWSGVFGVPVHLFAAYQYYGVAAFHPEQVVRHLNGDTLDFSKTNLVLGTASENNLDKTAEVRQAVARKARASQPISPGNSKLLPYQVVEIRCAYAQLTTKKAPNGFTKSLCATYGVSRTVIHKIITGKYYRES